MDWKTGILLALEELTRHRMRTLLTMLGMIFGVGAVIAMLSVGEGAEREALRLIEAMGMRNIVVRADELAADQLEEVRKKSLGLTLRDLEAARATVPTLGPSAALKAIDVYALFSHHATATAEVVGVSPAYFELAGLEVARGRTLHAMDDLRATQVCTIGGRVARDLFGVRDPIGAKLKVNETWLTVVGVLADRGLGRQDFEGVRLTGVHDKIYLPIATALKRFAFPPLEDELDELHLQVAEGYAVAATATAVARLLESRHRGQEDYTLVIPEALLEQNRQTRRIFNIVMSCIAGISLLVGGIGIMNIMLANVLERTWEIGVRRALGARKADIRRQFMIESFTIATVGGFLGVALGFTIAQGISLWSGWPVAWYLPGIVLAVGVCAGVGLGFGIYPAVKASELSPIEALRRG